ncbi:hypothetical protein ACSZOH_19115 [Aeromonas caviae]
MDDSVSARLIPSSRILLPTRCTTIILSCAELTSIISQSFDFQKCLQTDFGKTPCAPVLPIAQYGRFNASPMVTAYEHRLTRACASFVDKRSGLSGKMAQIEAALARCDAANPVF